MPKVSVIIPTYNRADLMREAVESVLVQTYKDFEIIVVDDGSTDNTGDILSGLEDPRLRMIRQENQGQGLARNTGILAAAGQYIAFLDSDDLWESKKLEKQITLFDEDEKLEWVYSDAYAFDDTTREKLFTFSRKSRQYEGYIAHKLFMHDFIATSTVMVRQRVFEKMGLFSDLSKAQDWEMWLRVAARHYIRKAPSALTGYRIHKDMITQEQNPIFKHQCHVEVLERAIRFAPEVYEPLHKRAIASQCVNTGQRLLARGNLKQARKFFINGICYSFSSVNAYVLLATTFLGNKIVNILMRIYKAFK